MLSREAFIEFAREAMRTLPAGCALAAPIGEALLADTLTPIGAYRRLVAPDRRDAPSFLLESVEGGERQGRYSILSARPMLEVVAHQSTVEVRTRTAHGTLGPAETRTHANPLALLREIAGTFALRTPAGGMLPSCVLGGWFGWVGYDSVRYVEPTKLPFAGAPRDDRGLPDVAMGLFDGVVVFDHVARVVHVVQLVIVPPGSEPGEAYDAAERSLRERVALLESVGPTLRAGRIPRVVTPAALRSNLTRDTHRAMVHKALEYIRAGDIFQVVLGQRFERESGADPFDVYRALRAVNPSPYMVSMQTRGCVLVASSPEILCRVRRSGAGELVVTNRPLAGTRKRGGTPEEDARLEAELRADPKERAEHIMLVDLGRNDVGRVAKPGSIALPVTMDVERYSHVMHLSSTVTGVLREGLDAWDALAATLPVGTISGAPKVRAMQVIDELEPVRRGPYGGGVGWVSLDGQMDMALTLRTIVAPFALAKGLSDSGAARWTYHLQASGGIVADSDVDAEYAETVNKAAALARAVDVAEAGIGEARAGRGAG